MKKPLSTALLFLVLILLMLPSFQKEVRIIPEAELNGFFSLEPEADLKSFTWKKWFQGEFQDQVSRRTEDHTGFRNSLFRLHNEYDYRLFGITHAEGFIRGKEGYLFEEDYILEYTGQYFIGKKTIDYKLEKLRQVYLRLEQAGIPFLLVFEPGKASFFPEYIPAPYHPQKRTLSNYEYISRRVQELGIPSMDMNILFRAMKDTIPYPLFPRYGMHWSIYGATIAADTIRNYLQYVCKATLPEVRISEIEVTDSLRWTDKDIGDMLNLIFPLPPDTLAYPVLVFDSASGKHLSILVIADSYYINMIHDVTGHLFRHHEYWYYNSKLYPHIIDTENPVYVDKSNLAVKLTGFDGILLMVSEINLHCGFWNFADEAYQAFYPDHQDPPWYPEQNNIMNIRGWFRYMVSKARENNMTLEEAIIKDAKYVYQTKNH